MDDVDELTEMRERCPEREWTTAGALHRGDEILWLGATVPSPVLSVRRRGQMVDVSHRDPDGVTYERRWPTSRPVPRAKR